MESLHVKRNKVTNMLRLRIGFIPNRATRNAAFQTCLSLITQVYLHLSTGTIVFLLFIHGNIVIASFSLELQ